MPDMIPTATFGRTGHRSTRAIFGGAALGNVSQAEADQTLDLLLQHGINHLDTARNYGDAELRIGPWMRRHRDHFFLATKTAERTCSQAREEIRQSLRRLETDHVDLIQLHCLIDPAEWDVALGPGGALEALIEARELGLARFIGVTGHDVVAPAMHLRSLDRFDFDAVLLPYNYLMMRNPEYAAAFEALLEVCRARDVAVQTIKGITRRRWGDQPPTRATWYEPLEDQGDVDLAVRYVLGRPGIFLNTVGDIAVLPRVLEAASRFETAPSDAEMADLARRREMAPMFA